MKTRWFKQSQPNPHHGSVPLNILKISWKDYKHLQKKGWLNHIRYVGSEWVTSQNTTLCMRGLWTKRQMYPYLKITQTVLFQPLHIVINDFILAQIYLSLSLHHLERMEYFYLTYQKVISLRNWIKLLLFQYSEMQAAISFSIALMLYFLWKRGGPYTFILFHPKRSEEMTQKQLFQSSLYQ